MKPQEDDIVLKLLHTADWHLGRRFPTFGAEASTTLSRARTDVLVRLFRAADRHRVDAVLCAGDLFDDASPPQEFRDALVAVLEAHTSAERPVFLLPGNHDPFLPDSVWADPTFRKRLPKHVTVVEAATTYTLANGAQLYAVPCLSRAGQADPTVSIPRRAPGDERLRIGLVHGSTFDAADAQLNFPISKDAALERGLDYLAIGDTHGFRFIPPDRPHPPTIYPGAPEPTAFDEKEPGHVAVVFLTRARRSQVHKERVAAWTWEEARVTSLLELRQLVARGDLRARVLRLTVDLSLDAPGLEEAERLLKQLAGDAARPALVGVLDLRTERLELDLSTSEAWTTGLPDVLQDAVRRLKAQAESQPEARRALFHLYQATRQRQASEGARSAGRTE
jgi:DNA repair exonuclease SbcCD nuclease subunit